MESNRNLWLKKNPMLYKILCCTQMRTMTTMNICDSTWCWLDKARTRCDTESSRNGALAQQTPLLLSFIASSTMSSKVNMTAASVPSPSFLVIALSWYLLLAAQGWWRPGWSYYTMWRLKLVTLTVETWQSRMPSERKVPVNFQELLQWKLAWRIAPRWLWYLW